MLRSWVILQKVTIEGRSYKPVSERRTESVSEECDKMWHEPSWQQQDSPPPVVIMGLMSQGESVDSGDSVPACYQACTSLTGQALSLERTESLPLDINSFITILLSLPVYVSFSYKLRGTQSQVQSLKFNDIELHSPLACPVFHW